MKNESFVLTMLVVLLSFCGCKTPKKQESVSPWEASYRAGNFVYNDEFFAENPDIYNERLRIERERELRKQHNKQNRKWIILEGIGNAIGGSGESVARRFE